MLDKDTPNGKRDQDNLEPNLSQMSSGTEEPQENGNGMLPSAPEQELDVRLEFDSEQEPSGDSNRPPKRSLDFLELIYGVMVQPGETFSYMAEARPLIQSLAFLFTAVIVNFIVNLGNLNSLPAELPVPINLSGILLPLFLIGLLSALIFWFIQTGTINLVSQLFGGVGNGLGLLCAFAFTTLPFMIVGILESLIRLFSSAVFLTGAIGLAGFIWFIVLNVLALEEIEHLSRGRAILVYFAVPLSIIVSVFIFIIVMIGVFAPVIPQLPLM